ncbi:hypothetical protein AB0O58_14920 [Rhodococcus sp. NPDC080181]|uniref:hypothetical protein n=1 Tax=Rhodococcus sp. NPDC080181 TaxID=3155292 RepID=UPI00344B474C
MTNLARHGRPVLVRKKRTFAQVLDQSAEEEARQPGRRGIELEVIPGVRVLEGVNKKLHDPVKYVDRDFTAIGEEIADRYIEAVQAISHARCGHPLEQRRAGCITALPNVSLDGLDEISEAVHRDSGVHRHRHDVVAASKFWEVAKSKFFQKGSERLPECVLKILVTFKAKFVPEALPVATLVVRQTRMSNERGERETRVSLDEPGGVI